MEKYRGFLICVGSYEIEESEWDGHSSKSYGTGQFENYYVAVSSKTGAESKHYDTLAQLKKAIDNTLDRKVELRDKLVDIRGKRASLAAKQRETVQKIDKLDAERKKIAKGIADLNNEMKAIESSVLRFDED